MAWSLWNHCGPSAIPGRPAIAARTAVSTAPRASVERHVVARAALSRVVHVHAEDDLVETSLVLRDPQHLARIRVVVLAVERDELDRGRTLSAASSSASASSAATPLALSSAPGEPLRLSMCAVSTIRLGRRRACARRRARRVAGMRRESMRRSSPARPRCAGAARRRRRSCTRSGCRSRRPRTAGTGTGCRRAAGPRPSRRRTATAGAALQRPDERLWLVGVVEGEVLRHELPGRDGPCSSTIGRSASPPRSPRRWRRRRAAPRRSTAASRARRARRTALPRLEHASPYSHSTHGNVVRRPRSRSDAIRSANSAVAARFPSPPTCRSGNAVSARRSASTPSNECFVHATPPSPRPRPASGRTRAVRSDGSTAVRHDALGRGGWAVIVRW